MAKTAPINMRVEPEQHALLTKVAALLHKDRSTFILEAACREAENILLDRRLFQLDDEQFEKFDKALSEPVPTNPKLVKLLKEMPVWEK